MNDSEHAALPGEWADHPDRPCIDPALGTDRQRARIFFPDRGESAAPAKTACGRCPVKNECLEFALSNGEKFGIWGGASERERRRIRRRRSAA